LRWGNSRLTQDGRCFGLSTGHRYKALGHLVVIDIDNKAETDDEGNVTVENGLTAWNRLILEHDGFESPEDVDTAVEITSGGGYHYYYYVPEEDYKNVSKKFIKLYAGDQQTAIDYLAGGQACHHAPTYCHRGDRGWQYTKWVDGKSLNDRDPAPLPQWIYEMILNSQQKPSKSTGKGTGKSRAYTGISEKNNWEDKLTPKIENQDDLHQFCVDSTKITMHRTMNFTDW